MTGFTAQDVPDQSGKCFLITGANSGLGFETSKVLAARGARVLMACRSEDKAQEAIRLIRSETPNADVAFLPLDLADLNSVRACAEEVANEPRLDVLINNAGIMFPPLQRTAQGHELQFGVNHLGPFALTGLVLPKLAENAGARIVITSSLAHMGGHLEWDDLDSHKSYGRGKRYSDSKFANILHLLELDRRLRAAGSPVTAVGCHPGFAGTSLGQNSGPYKFIFPISALLFNSAAQGAWPTLQAAAAPSVEPGGYYGPQGLGGLRGPSGLAKRSKAAHDGGQARRLWDVSVEMTGVDYGLPPVQE